MKTNYFTILAILFALPLFYSCGDDNNTTPDKPEEKPGNKPDNVDFDITEVSESNLSNGQTARFTKNNDGTYTLTLNGGNFDLSSVEGNPCNGIVEVPGPVLGMRECSIPVSVDINDDKTGYTFSGSFKNDIIEFSTKGKIENKYIQFDNSTIVETAFMPGLPEIEQFYNYLFCMTKGSVLDNETNSFISSPYFIECKTSDNPLGADFKASTSEILQHILNTPFLSLKEYGFDKVNIDIVSPASLFRLFFSGVSINSYGKTHSPLTVFAPSNAVAVNSSTSTFYKQSFLFPEQTFVVLPTTNNRFRLFINPGYLFDIKYTSEQYLNSSFPEKSITKPVKTPATLSILSNIISALSPANSTGLEMDFSYNFNENNNNGTIAFIFADTSTSLKFLKAFLMPLLDNETNKNRLISELSKNPLLNATDISAESIINKLPSILESITELKFGFNHLLLSPIETEKELESIYRQIL